MRASPTRSSTRGTTTPPTSRTCTAASGSWSTAEHRGLHRCPPARLRRPGDADVDAQAAAIVRARRELVGAEAALHGDRERREGVGGVADRLDDPARVRGYLDVAAPAGARHGHLHAARAAFEFETRSAWRAPAGEHQPHGTIRGHPEAAG